MSEILCNDKVKKDYLFFVCIKEEKVDMMATVLERCKYGYKKTNEFEDENNYVVILSK